MNLLLLKMQPAQLFNDEHNKASPYPVGNDCGQLGRNMSA